MTNQQFNKLNLLLFFLTIKNRHLWKHHYLGTQGVILTFSFKNNNNLDSLFFETINVLKDSFLADVPFLVLLDKNANGQEEVINKFRTFLLQEQIIHNVQYINFLHPEELFYGLSWLCEVMEPL